jgi:electron transfer flavoprotein alpha/beta subunit
MKNVMMAKKAAIASWKAPEADDARASGLHLDKVQAAPEPQRRTESEWLQGTPRQKADALAQMLRSASQS